MKNFYLFMFSAISLAVNTSVSASALCGDPAQPLLSVADFDGNGIVNAKDISTLAQHVGTDRYYALYDMDADGALTGADVGLATKDLDQVSTATDQEMAAIYNRFKYLQDVQGNDQLALLGYFSIPPALKGHGTHWFNSAGIASMFGQKLPSIYTAEGLNISSDRQAVHANFWANPATLVFANGATDYPTGENWKDSQVISFSNTPPSLTNNETESWHKHGGLCMTVLHSYDANGNLVRTGSANQHTTYNECQAFPNDEPQTDGTNMWANFWMVHIWLYDLNPNGLFAGTHPCVDSDGLDESTINGDRNVPHFFQHH